MAGEKSGSLFVDFGGEKPTVDVLGGPAFLMRVYAFGIFLL